MENKKTKLTISGSPKKSYKNIETSKSEGKKTVVIEKKTGKTINKTGSTKSFGSRPSSSSFKHGSYLKPNFLSKTPATPKSVEQDEKTAPSDAVANIVIIVSGQFGI